MLSTREIAEHLHVSRWTAKRLADEFMAPGRDGRNRRRVTTDLYLAWLNAVVPSHEEEMAMSEGLLPRLIPIEVFAEENNINLRLLQDSARRREFAYTQIGKRRYFTEEQLKAYLRGQAVDAERPKDDLADVRVRVSRRRDRRPANV